MNYHTLGVVKFYAMKLLSKISFALCLALMFVGCRKSGTFDDTPFLKYKSYEFTEDASNGRDSYLLTIFFTDGDGDVGKLEGQSFDTCSESGYNFLIRYFEKVGEDFKEIQPRDSCLPFHNILPNLTDIGQNKTLEGDIIATFPYAGFPINATDSIKFEFVLIDRSGKRSKPVESEVIPVQ